MINAAIPGPWLWSCGLGAEFGQDPLAAVSEEVPWPGHQCHVPGRAGTARPQASRFGLSSRRPSYRLGSCLRKQSGPRLHATLQATIPGGSPPVVPEPCLPAAVPMR